MVSRPALIEEEVPNHTTIGIPWLTDMFLKRNSGGGVDEVGVGNWKRGGRGNFDWDLNKQTNKIVLFTHAHTHTLTHIRTHKSSQRDFEKY